MKPKPGYLTTEFWLSAIGVIAEVAHQISTDVPTNGWTIALITAGYAIARAVTKRVAATPPSQSPVAATSPSPSASTP
jgi:hypothetical protein